MRSIRSCPLAWLSSPSWLGIFGACWKLGPAVGVNEPSTNWNQAPRKLDTWFPKFIGKWKMRGKTLKMKEKLVLKFWWVDIESQQRLGAKQVFVRSACFAGCMVTWMVGFSWSCIFKNCCYRCYSQMRHSIGGIDVVHMKTIRVINRR